MIIEPTYGVGFMRMGSWGPAWFAMGINYGNTPPEETKRVISWRQSISADLFLDGFLGGVFPWNFLTHPQLQARVGSKTLEEWVQSQPQRGSLRPITDRMVLWSVPDEDIPAVYQALWEAEVVFDYQRHIERGGPGIIRRGDKVRGLPNQPAKFTADSQDVAGQQVLGQILNAMGYSPEEAQVLKVEKPGQLRELTTEEVKAIQQKGKKPPKKK